MLPTVDQATFLAEHEGTCLSRAFGPYAELAVLLKVQHQ